MSDMTCYFCDMPAKYSLIVSDQPKHANVLLDQFGDHWFQHFCEIHYRAVLDVRRDLTRAIEAPEIDRVGHTSDPKKVAR
jgi:hypothetical protein